jgi:periplasmic divalent cation tolerance protein
MSDHVVVFVTAPSAAEAESIATRLLERKLIACANLLPGVTSLFWWEGQRDRAEEAMVVMKTRRDLVDQLTAAVIETHSYEVCEVIALPIVAGSEAYLKWIDESVG